MKPKSHTPQNKIPPSRLLQALWLVTCVLLIGIEWQLWTKYSLTTSVVAHSILVCVTAGFAFLLRRHVDPRLPVLTTILLAFFGPFGVLLSLGVGLLQIVFSYQGQDIQQTIEALFPPDEDLELEMAVEAILDGSDALHRDDRPISLIDVMYYASIEQKRETVSLVLRHYSPKLLPVLRLALQDSDNSIRVLAANAIVALQERYYDAFAMAKEFWEQAPLSPEASLECAHAGLRFIQSGLADRQRAAKVREFCTQLLAQVVDKRKDDARLMGQLARLYEQEKQWEKAEKLARLAIESSVYPPPELLIILSTILYRQENYTRLRASLADRRWAEQVYGNAVLSFWKAKT